ncbi:MAG TPA: HAD-IC family P-type ATPase, partial [Acidimicrobiales bacterium]|nr:HAD-IC family P-type ATPase [Acidimicrobiales bacterium]
MAHLDVDPADGLGTGEAQRRLAEHGPNQLAEAPRRPAWRLLLDQFRNLLVVILLVGAVLAGLVGDLKDAVVIAVVLVLNAALGFVQESRAERSLDALRSMLVIPARVRRDGGVTEIPAEAVVPGDVILLDAGDRVPADARLLVAHGLEVDESSLTGESSPVAKRVGPTPPGSPLADRVGLAHMNTVVTRGRAEAVVTATGAATEIGRVAELIRTTDDPGTPLQRQLAGLGRRLAAVAGVAVIVFLATTAARGEPLGDTVVDAVALAVAAVPEGLPAVVTVTLAVGVHRMAGRGAIVKRLASVETLGATTVICTDKTGTLTLNRMTAREAVVHGGRVDLDALGTAPGSDEPLLGTLAEAAVLCNDSTVDGGVVRGDPTERALVEMAVRVGLDPTAARAAAPRRAELPFDSARKLMATWHLAPGGSLLVVKGAPDVVLERCTRLATARGPVDLDDAARRWATDELHGLAAQGRRVLALATADVPAPPPGPDADPDGLAAAADDLTLVGLVGLVDPPRPEAREAVATCRRAGVAVKMITGDHAATATAIAT